MLLTLHMFRVLHVHTMSMPAAEAMSIGRAFQRDHIVYSWYILQQGSTWKKVVLWSRTLYEVSDALMAAKV